MRNRVLKNVFVAALFLCSVTYVSAQAMQSASYRIQNDSINVGGMYATSTNYGLEDTTGEVATGESTSTNYALHAGFQQMQESYIALSSASDVTLLPSLGGLTGGTSTGYAVLTATTDNYAGYQMTIAASSSPALQSGANSISDYVPSGADPDFVFTTGSGQAHFAFSPEGTDIAQRFRDNGAACNIGSGESTNRCWDGLSTTPVVIAERASANHPSGTDTTIQFTVGIGSPATVAEGTYVATTTVTLLAL